MSDIKSFLFNMCIATYLNKEPDAQVRKMAKRYKRITKDKSTQRSLRTILRSPFPAKLVNISYDKLQSK